MLIVLHNMVLRIQTEVSINQRLNSELKYFMHHEYIYCFLILIAHIDLIYHLSCLGYLHESPNIY